MVLNLWFPEIVIPTLSTYQFTQHPDPCTTCLVIILATAFAVHCVLPQNSLKGIVHKQGTEIIERAQQNKENGERILKIGPYIAK